jgi:hypothetical protein
MMAVVSRERAKATCLTGAVGALILAVACVMMVMAAPGHAQAGLQGQAKPPAVQLTTDLGRQLTSRSDAYVPSMISESWSASLSGRAAGPELLANSPLANSAVS